MAMVQATFDSTVLSAQGRTVRAASATTWSPPSGVMHSRPWRSSPLAGPAFSTLPPIISESSEESYEDDLAASKSARELGQTRSPSSSSIVSDSQAASVSASASGYYGSRNASGSAFEGESSTSSISLLPSSSTHGHGTGTSSSQGHGNSQTHSNRPARLSKSWGRRPSTAQSDLRSSRNVSEVFITPPPRARTVSHGHSRPASFPAQSIPLSPTIPQAYSRASPRPTLSESEANTAKQPSSKARDPSSNWMSSSPFGPATTPKFSRLAMASPAVVMPLSAREYRKRKAKESHGKGGEKELTASSNRVTFTDSVLSVSQSPNGVPLVKISPPPSEDVHPPHLPPSSSGDHSPTQPQPQVDHPRKPLPHATLSAQSHPRPSSSKQKRPHTPPRSSPLATHPPISPKSSTGTFFSLASVSVSVSDDDTPLPFHPQGADDPPATNTVPPARPRLRPRRRKSYPDRLSNGARLSLIEAMNRLSQESATLHRLSAHSQTDGVNRLSVASQASGHTLFYDVVESEGEGQVVGGGGDGDGDGGQRTSILHTQSLEDLSSTLARTGIEVIHPDGDGNLSAPLDEERKGKRNVRMVRISDTVEVSPPPMPRRRKLTKSRPGPARGLAPTFGVGPGPGTGSGIVKEMKVQTQMQTQQRRASLLPWKSKGSGDSKGGAVGARSGVAAVASEKGGEDAHPSTPVNGLVHPSETTAPTPVPHSLAPIANRSGHVESHLGRGSNGTPAEKSSSDIPTSTPSTPPPKARRYTFSFLPSPIFHRPKREKSNTAPARVDLGSGRNTKGKPKEIIKAIESGTDSTSTSIRTITQGSQTTLTPTSPVHYDLTTLASSGLLSEAGRGTGSSAVPMLRRLNAQAMAMTGAPSQSEWDGGGSSTPSLITNGSTATSSSVPRTSTLPSFVHLSPPDGVGEPFLPRPSGLKECFTDTSEEDSDGVLGGERMSGMCVRRRHDQSPLARADVGRAETSEEDEQVRLHARSSSGLSLSPSPRPASRPDTSSSTLTTATEASDSYISFSTLPASTASSRSTSPLPMTMGDKRDWVVPVPLDGDGDVHSCTLCGHLVPQSSSPSPPDRSDMHPMFTVPLVTVPAGTYPRSMLVSSSNTPLAMRQAGMGGERDAVMEIGMGGGARYAGGRKSERYGSVPVPAAVGVGGRVSPTRNVHNHMHTHTRVNVNEGYSPGAATTTAWSPPPLPSPSKVRKNRRPQTAPAGAGDAAFKFIEDAKAMRMREGSVDVGGDRPTKYKVGGGESKFKTVLKGLLRWGG